MRTKTKIKSEVLKIRKGLFFPEDFAKLPEGTFIYVAEGALINIDEGNSETETETVEETGSEERVKKKHRKHRKRKYTKREGIVYGGPRGPRKKAYERTDSKEIEKEEEVTESDKSSEEETDEETEEQPGRNKYFEFPRKKVQYSDLHGNAE